MSLPPARLFITSFTTSYAKYAELISVITYYFLAFHDPRTTINCNVRRLYLLLLLLCYIFHKLLGRLVEGPQTNFLSYFTLFTFYFGFFSLFLNSVRVLVSSAHTNCRAKTDNRLTRKRITTLDNSNECSLLIIYCPSVGDEERDEKGKRRRATEGQKNGQRRMP